MCVFVLRETERDRERDGEIEKESSPSSSRPRCMYDVFSGNTIDNKYYSKLLAFN